MSQLGRGKKKPKKVSGARFAPATRHSDGPARPPHTVPTSGFPADTREHDEPGDATGEKGGPHDQETNAAPGQGQGRSGQGRAVPRHPTNRKG
jgi:hypothetical protein